MRLSALTSPPFSPICIMPIHRDNTPVRPREISKAVFAEEKVLSIMAGNTEVSPMNTRRTSAMRNAMRKNPIQM